MHTQQQNARAIGFAGIAVAVPTLFIQFLGGLCCGWIGWPLGIAAIVLGILAITRGEKTLGIVAIVMSVIGFIAQIVFFTLLTATPPENY